MLAMALLVGAASWRATRRWSPRAAAIVVAVAAVWMLVNAFLLTDNPRLARILPFSNVIVLGNFQPLAAAMMIGAGWRLLPRSQLRRGTLVSLLVLVCLWKSYGILLSRAPEGLRDRWKSGVCIQTSDKTCTAAAAATLLKQAGIAASESEMADLCLTRGGTMGLGMYRGLKLKTAGTAWDVEPITGSVSQLRAMIGASPAIVSVGVDPGENLDPRYTTEWGWTPGVRHTVVVLNWRDDGKVDIADPSVGREQWFERNLLDLWKGRGFRLVKRSP
jgi:hypothetical protein